MNRHDPSNSSKITAHPTLAVREIQSRCGLTTTVTWTGVPDGFNACAIQEVAHALCDAALDDVCWKEAYPRFKQIEADAGDMELVSVVG